MATASPTRADAIDCANVIDVSVAECNALVDIYTSMDGENWFDNTGWLTDDDDTVCDWSGIVCDSGTVIDFYLDGNANGVVPASIGDLTGVNYLYLSSPTFVGPLPDLSPRGEVSATTLGGSGPTNRADTTSTGIPQAECNALVTMYNNNGGENWTVKTNWLSGSPCTWYGITCHSGHVTQVNMDNNNLTGTVPNLNALETQTVPPSDLATGAIGDNSVELTWTPILYTANGGYYEVGVRAGSTGPFSFGGVHTTADKTAGGFTVSGLNSGTLYCFVVRTFTPQHNPNMFNGNKNELMGNIIVNTPSPMFNFTITSGQNLTGLRLVVTRNNTTTPAYNQVFDPAIVCTGTDCQITPPTALKNGAYTWVVRAVNINGNTPSFAGAFRIAFPDKATNLSPTGGSIVTTNNPLLTWDEVGNATEYRICLINVKTGKFWVTPWMTSGVTSGFDCDGTTCTLSEISLFGRAMLSNGRYDWFVQARNTGVIAGSVSKSATARFRVNAPLRAADSAEGEQDSPLPLPPMQ